MRIEGTAAANADVGSRKERAFPNGTRGGAAAAAADAVEVDASAGGDSPDGVGAGWDEGWGMDINF